MESFKHDGRQKKVTKAFSSIYQMEGSDMMRTFFRLTPACTHKLYWFSVRLVVSLNFSLVSFIVKRSRSFMFQCAVISD